MTISRPNGAGLGAVVATQAIDRPGIIDLGSGLPDPALLPVEAIGGAARAALRRRGADALQYGRSAGAMPLVEWLAAHLGSIDGRAPARDEILVTGGVSQALDQVATLLARPGDTVLVESPTYHLGVRILRDHPLELVGVATDDRGIRVDQVAEAADRVRRSRRSGDGPRRVFLYLVPTFSNPTGATLPLDRRRALVEVAERADITVIEDDVYRELAFEEPAPPSLWSLAPPGRVVRLGSFSKTLAPGFRLGWLTADAATVNRFAGGGLLDSGGGMNPFLAHVAAEFCTSGAYADNVARLRAAYAHRAGALAAAVAEHLPTGCHATRPRGGFFEWVTLPAPLDAGALLEQAEGAGTSYVPGSVFHVDGRGAGRDALRLSFSRYGPDDLREAACRLGRAVRRALEDT